MKTEASENGFKSGVLKTYRFENAPFLVWTGENGGFWKRWRKKRHILSLPSAFSGVLVWTIGENASMGENILLRFGWDENGYL
jgi:hypothetical protein